MANFPFNGGGVALVGGGGDVTIPSSQPWYYVFVSSEVWTVPETGIYRILCCGGGGNGGTGTTSSGGGAGGLAIKRRVKLTEGDQINVIVGGAQGQSMVDASAADLLLIANAGGDGQSGASLSGGAGGTASGGDYNGTGGSGGDSPETGISGGGGVNFYGRDTSGASFSGGAGGGVGSAGIGILQGGSLFTARARGSSLNAGGDLFTPLGGGGTQDAVAGIGGSNRAYPPHIYAGASGATTNDANDAVVGGGGGGNGGTGGQGLVVIQRIG